MLGTLMEEYESGFREGFPVRSFPGVHELLRILAEPPAVGQVEQTPLPRLAIVTSNTSDNVRRAMGMPPPAEGAAPLGREGVFEFIMGVDSGERSKARPPPPPPPPPPPQQQQQQQQHCGRSLAGPWHAGARHCPPTTLFLLIVSFWVLCVAV